MNYFSTPEAESGRSSLPATFSWKGASKASICAFMLAFAPIAVSVAQTNNDTDNSDYVAPAAPAAPASDDSDNSGYVAPAAAASGDEATSPAEAVPAAPAAAAAPASATNPTAASTTDLGNVIVTGSAIPRADAKTALPVTVYDADKLREQGITSTAGILSRVAANDTSSGPGAGYGLSITGGASFANLRGLGPNSTLVLLNGRRLANNAFDGGAVGLNSIPFAAIERVEVLRSGASAIYGTDAVGGVINFITKKNFTGGDFGVTYELPTRDGGGNTRLLEATFGKGNLVKDRFNLMGSVTFRQQDPIAAANRQGIVYPYRPGRGLDTTSRYTVPANYYQGGLEGNPALAQNGGCPGRFQIHKPGATTCAANPTQFYQLQQSDDNVSFFGQGKFAITPDHTLSASYLFNHDEVNSQIGPYGVYGYLQPDSPNFPGTGSNGVPDNVGIDPSRPVLIRFQNSVTGPRSTRNLDQAQRAVIDLAGHFGKTHYDTAFTFNQQTTVQTYTGGYLNANALEDPTRGPTNNDDPGQDLFDEALNSGLVNPFSTTLSRDAQNFFNNLVVRGQAEKDRGQVWHWDGKVNREIGDWFGAGQVQFALGSDVRYETLDVESNGSVQNKIAGGGLSGKNISQHRTVEGVYAEMSVPLLDSVELDGAARYDNYSDFGDTINPKVSLRYQPIKQVVLRGSYSEGYQAPTLYDLYTPQSITYSQNGLNDPVLCAGGNPSPGYSRSDVCNTQFERHYGGNNDLKPATSEQYNFGLILQPLDKVYAEVDYYHVRLTQQANLLPVNLVFNNLGRYGNSIVRYGADSPRAGQINYISTPYTNLGTTVSEGLDTKLNASYDFGEFGAFTLSMEGTYVLNYDYQDSPQAEFQSNEGKFVDYSPIIQWQHNITLGWSKARYNAAVINHYTSGYKDADPETNSDVNAFITWDALVGYHFENGIQLTLGANNVFDQAPPFSNQSVLGISGYDPRYADAIGRSVYGKLEYRF